MDEVVAHYNLEEGDTEAYDEEAEQIGSDLRSHAQVPGREIREKVIRNVTNAQPPPYPANCIQYYHENTG